MPVPRKFLLEANLYSTTIRTQSTRKNILAHKTPWANTWSKNFVPYDSDLKWKKGSHRNYHPTKTKRWLQSPCEKDQTASPTTERRKSTIQHHSAPSLSLSQAIKWTRKSIKLTSRKLELYSDFLLGTTPSYAAKTPRRESLENEIRKGKCLQRCGGPLVEQGELRCMH